MSGRYSPSEAARRSGFSLDTLRYYEKIGLLSGIGRTAGGRRVFTDEDLGWLEVFRCLRDTGMPIAEMCRYAELARQGDRTLGARRALFEAHRGRVLARMAELAEDLKVLDYKIDAYRRAEEELS